MDAPGDADSSGGVPTITDSIIPLSLAGRESKIDYSQENQEQMEEEADKTT